MSPCPRVGAGGGGGGQATPTRVLAVIDWLEVGGAQQHLLTLARGLTGANYRFVVATSGSEPLAATFRREGIPILTLTHRSIKHRLSPVFVARLAWLASRGAFDLIHGHLHSASVAAAVAARASGLPLVLTHHSMNTWRPAWQGVLGRWADRQADAVIAVAANIARAVERGGVRAWIIPNGVPALTAPWCAEQIATVRAQLGVPTTAYVISYVGRFSRDKNPLLFVETAAIVAARCPSAHFLMIGDGPLRPAVEARRSALGLERRLTLAGFRPNAAELHQASDVLALTSDSEGAPLVVLEAMVASRPVVATVVGDVPTQIVDGETGYVVAPRDVCGLAEALAALADSALRSRFGRAARERVLRYFVADHCLAQTAVVYDKAIERHALRGRQMSEVRYQRADVEWQPSGHPSAGRVISHQLSAYAPMITTTDGAVEPAHDHESVLLSSTSADT